MDQTEFLKLIDRYLQGEASPVEEKMLVNFFESFQDGETDWDDALYGVKKELEAKMLTNITHTIRKEPQRHFPWLNIAAAAIILMVGGLAVKLLYLQKKATTTQQVAAHASTIAPVNTMAILKSGGKITHLHNAMRGALTGSVQKTGESDLMIAGNTASKFDTIQIPAGGGTYRLHFADGSRVLLNAASTLRFPEHMGTDQRGGFELIEGEAYFEVAHHDKYPLILKAGNQQIVDIGTQFNTAVYPGENANTTLLEGKVKVNAFMLKPGEKMEGISAPKVLERNNLDAVVAWTKGDFNFNGENIYQIMKQLARWYNVDVVYKNNMTNQGFYGRIARSRKIAEVLKMLEKTKLVYFKIEGRRVLVWSK